MKLILQPRVCARPGAVMKVSACRFKLPKLVQVPSVFYLSSDNPDRQYALVFYSWYIWTALEKVAQVFELHRHRLTVIQELDCNDEFYDMSTVYEGFETPKPAISFNEKSRTLTMRSAHDLLDDTSDCVSAMDVFVLRWKRSRFIQTNAHSGLTRCGNEIFRNLDRMARHNLNIASAVNRGIFFMREGENDLALQDLDQAVCLNPTDRNVLYNRGITYNNKR